MSKRGRGPDDPGALTPGQLDDVRRHLEAACAAISQLEEERLPGLAASLASLRGAAARLVEAADAAASTNRHCALLELPRELSVRVLAECDGEALARVDSCSRALHTASPGTGMSLTNEGASRALAKLPVELAALVPLGSSAARRLQLARQLQDTGEEWQLTLASRMETEAPLIMPAMAGVASQLSICLDVVALRALDFAPIFSDADSSSHDSHTEVQRAVVKALGAVWLDGSSSFWQQPHWFDQHVPNPQPGALTVRLVAEVMQAADQPDAVRAMAEQLALRMVPELVSLRVGTPWCLQSFGECYRSGQPSFGRPAGQFPEVEAKFQKAAALLRAVWERRRAAGAEAAASVAAAAAAAAALATGAFATAAAQAAAQEAAAEADVGAVHAAAMEALTASGSSETLALGGHVAWLLTELNQVQEAEAFLLQLIPVLQGCQGTRALDTVACHSLLLKLLVSARRWEEAETLLTELPVEAKAPPPSYDFYRVEDQIKWSAARMMDEIEKDEVEKGQDFGLQEQLLRACIARGYKWAEHRLKGFLVRQGRLDGVEVLRKEMQKADSAAPTQLQAAQLQAVKAFGRPLEYLEPTSAAMLHMQLVAHLDEKGRADEAAQERERLVLRYVEDMSSVHDQSLEADFEPAADIKRVRELCNVPYGASRVLQAGSSRYGENDGLRFCLRYRDALTKLMADLEERVEAVLSQRVSEANEKHGADSVQAWCATARLMTLLDETKQAAAALPLAREFMALAERRLGTEHSVTLEAISYVGVLCNDVGAIDEAVQLTQQVYDALLRQTPNGDDEARRSLLWSLVGHDMTLSDCGEQLARMQGRHGRHFEATETLKRLLTDLGEPVSENERSSWSWLMQKLADQLVRCMFQTLTENRAWPLSHPATHTLCLIGPQESAGNLDEAAGVMAQLIAQMDDGRRPIARALNIFQLSRLRTSMLTRSLSALCALKALSALRLSYICSLLPIQSHLLCRFQDAGALSSLSPAPQQCCCCATGLLAADGLASLHACTPASHGISHNSSSSLATKAR